MDEVERLHGLAGRALDEVVLDADGDDPAGPLVEADVDEHVVAAGRVLGRRRRGHDPDERLARVRGRVELVELVLRDRAGRADVVRRVDPAGHRDEVRDEVDGDGAGVRARVEALAGGRDRELLLDLGDVAMAAETVGLHVLVDLAEHHVGLRVAAGAGDAALRVDHEVADEPGTGERGERQQRRRRDSSPGAPTSAIGASTRASSSARCSSGSP